MDTEEDEAEDLLKEIENSLKMRKWGFPVRIELESSMEESLKKFLISSLELSEEKIYSITGPIDLTFFMKFYDIDGFDKLRFPREYPVPSVEFFGRESMFDVIREQRRLSRKMPRSMNRDKARIRVEIGRAHV